jgi:hypothetical protein
MEALHLLAHVVLQRLCFAMLLALLSSACRLERVLGLGEMVEKARRDLGPALHVVLAAEDGV